MCFTILQGQMQRGIKGHTLSSVWMKEPAIGRAEGNIMLRGPVDDALPVSVSVHIVYDDTDPNVQAANTF